MKNENNYNDIGRRTMLYKYIEKNKTLEMMSSKDFKDIGGTEKDLENLLAENLSDFLSEGQLMPIFQERPRQEEPDLLALDRNGNLVIFELKRETVKESTTIQIMRYCQLYGRKSYSDLLDLYKNYKKYSNGECKDLKVAHQEVFGLKNPLNDEDFNKKQKLIIVGSSSDSALMVAVDYWKNIGIDIDFIPYRFYAIGEEKYFEFFAKPYDYHVNNTKGIIFDTNKTYNKDAIWDMIENKKVSAYGDAKKYVTYFSRGDYVLYYHSGLGVICAGIIEGDKVEENKEKDEWYRKVKLLAPIPKKGDKIQYISSMEISAFLNKNFYWANTTKRPYLSVDEAEILIKLLQEKYERLKESCEGQEA